MDKRVSKAYDIIKRSYQKKMLLKELAKKVDLSPFFFQKLFKKELGESPLACINRVRLEQAAHLIRVQHGVSMADIAMDCGFSSPSVFARAFTKKYGVSPVQFAGQSIAFATSDTQTKLDVSVVYFPGTKIFYNHTSYYSPGLLRQFELAKSTCERKGIAHTGKMMGILTHMHFHARRDELNYYAGVEINSEQTGEKIFEIPSGKYASFATKHSYHSLLELMIQFKTQWLDQQPYFMKDIFAFEIIDPKTHDENYPFINRQIYVPVNPKK